jgi:hypothetical protein
MDLSLKKWARRRSGSAGEGSRGGHVIGHTKSGKPIYAPREGHADASAADLTQRGWQSAKENGQGYSRQDHYDAAKALKVAAKQALAQGKTAHAYHMGAIAGGHKNHARGADAYGAKAA